MEIDGHVIAHLCTRPAAPHHSAAAQRAARHGKLAGMKVCVLALVAVLLGACSDGGGTSRSSAPTSTTTAAATARPARSTVGLVPASAALTAQCQTASRELGFAVPCPTRVVTRAGQPMACTPLPTPTSLPLCVGPQHDFFLEWNGFDVPPTFAGVDGEPIGHVIVHAAPVSSSPPRPCIAGVRIGTFSVLGVQTTMYRCPPDSPLVQRTARHGEGAYTSHVLLSWQRDGIAYLVSSHGYGDASVTLMEQLAASLSLVAP